MCVGPLIRLIVKSSPKPDLLEWSAEIADRVAAGQATLLGAGRLHSS
jgi:hypothetical protein